MAINITNDQFRAALQNIQNRYIRIELLNYQYQTVDQIEGICTAGSVTIDANSDIRRTANVTLIVTSSSFNVGPDKEIWLDKYIRIWVGTMINYTQEINWVNCGVYIIDAPSYTFDPSNNTLSLSCLDLMAKLTGVRDGYLPGLPVLLEAGENIREAIIDTIALGGFTKYLVDEAPSPGTIPNDINLSQGATIYNILTELRDIYPLHQIYFDTNMTFNYNQIPNGVDEPIAVDDTLWDKIVTKEQINLDFQNVKNSIEIYGKTHDPAHFSTETTVSSNTINLTIADVSEYVEDMIYGFTLTDNPGYTGASLKINSLTSYPLRLLDGTTAAEIKAEEGEIYYCVQFKGTYWLWLGHLQSYAKVEDNDPDSPFYVEGKVGRIHTVFTGGEYENIYSDELARERAELELYLHSFMNDSLTLTCSPVYFLDVNILTSYTSKRTGETKQYLIKNINMGLAPSDSMTVQLTRFTPEIFNSDY